MFIKQEDVKRIRNWYKKGDRVRLLRMDGEEQRLPKGTLGTVSHVDDAGTIHIQWDNGSTLGAVQPEDIVEKI